MRLTKSPSNGHHLALRKGKAMKPVIIGGCTLYLGDCMDILPTLGKVDAVVTDPPYGIARDYLKAGTAGEWSKLYSTQIEWDDIAPQQSIEFSISISNYAVIWGGNYFSLSPMRGWFIWDKMQNHSSGHAELAWTNLDIPIRNFSYCRAQLANEGKNHPTQKPISLMKWCIEQLPANCETILDPFMGSGTTGVACAKMGRKFIGIELEPKYFDIACERIRKAYAQPDMFIEPQPKPEQVKFEL